MNSSTQVQNEPPDWLPDWTDKTKYPDPKHTSRRQWAWEFLRRNAGYQQLCNENDAYLHRGDNLKKVEPGTETYQELEESEPLLSTGKMRSPKEFGLLLRAPPSMPSTDPRFGDRRPRFLTEHVTYWMRPVNWPSEEYGPFEIHEVLEDPAEVVISVNLRWSLRRQIDAAERVLKSEKKHLTSLGILKASDRRMKPEHFQSYLRLLDAEAKKASPKEMAEVIFGIIDKYPDHKGQQRVHDGLKSAKFLRDRGYMFLAMG